MSRLFTRGSVLVFTAAILVRVAFLFVFFRTVPLQKIWGTGIETGNIAASLSSGHGFASPFGIETGASAWIAPVYAGSVAVFFKLFGPYSAAAAWAVLLLNSLFGSLTALLLHRTRFPRGRAGPIAAWIWALSPYAIIMCVKVWETSLSALLTLCGILMYSWLSEQEGLGSWITWSLFWSLTTLVNPSLAILFPVLSLGAMGRHRQHAFARLALAAMIFCAGLSPWLVRNYVRFHTLFPIRSNFGEELWLGNHEGVQGPNDETRHPLAVPGELAAYRSLGERDYVDAKRRAALNFIANHPGEFTRLTVSRILFFWRAPEKSFWLLISLMAFCGLALACLKDFHAALPFAGALLLYPLPYYVTHSDNWYRHPIEPAIILLSVSAVCTVFEMRRHSQMPSAARFTNVVSKVP